MQIRSSIIKLRTVAFLLFLVPTIALIGSLIFHNYLVSFKFESKYRPDFIKNLPGEKAIIECNEQNNFCDDLNHREKKRTLFDCTKYNFEKKIYFASRSELDPKMINQLISGETTIKELSKEFDEKIIMEWTLLDTLNQQCILNSKLIKYYNLAPFIFEKIYALRTSPKTSMGTSVIVNPIIYGEASISNIVKRYPVKWIFKPLMYLSVILMLAYWYYNNLVLNTLLERKKNKEFFLFGILSAIFLLLHVIFLGWNFENEILKKGRRYFVVFFILFEILAQAYLIKDIFKNKTIIRSFLNNIIINLKLIFVVLICLSTLIIIVILSIYNLSDEVDYIIEWNYFLILLFFYLLSSLLWKKNY
tara:strand:- start:303 stop:1385 length:1083 start_codon:yes stop_codon:yes gene_type:complete